MIILVTSSPVFDSKASTTSRIPTASVTATSPILSLILSILVAPRSCSYTFIFVCSLASFTHSCIHRSRSLASLARVPPLDRLSVLLTISSQTDTAYHCSSLVVPFDCDHCGSLYQHSFCADLSVVAPVCRVVLATLLSPVLHRSVLRASLSSLM